MTEVGGGASRTMKVCGTTESILINSIRLFNYVCGNRYEMVYFEAIITEVCGAISHKTDELVVRKIQVDGTKLLIYITHMYIFWHTFIGVV